MDIILEGNMLKKHFQSFLMTFSLRFFLIQKTHLICYRICARSLSAIVKYHNRCFELTPTIKNCNSSSSSKKLGHSVFSFFLPFRQNKPRNGSICVANHTTPIDVIILANDGCYSLVSGFFKVYFAFFLYE